MTPQPFPFVIVLCALVGALAFCCGLYGFLRECERPAGKEYGRFTVPHDKL
jgi:hypothetical protein